MRRDKPGRPWHLYVLALAAIAVAVLAIVEIGPPGSSSRSAREVVTAATGVVQSTVTGSGNLSAGTDVDVNFRTSGTLQNVYVSAGQHVTQGQLIATLDPSSAQLSLDQAQESLTAAQDQLTEVEAGTASGGSGGSSGSGSSGSGNSQNASYERSSSSPEFVSDVTTITFATKQAKKKKKPKAKKPTPNTNSGSKGSAGRSSNSGSGSSSNSASHASNSNTTTTTTPSPSSIASAQASIYGAQANVDSAQTALNNTKLYAPASGTIVSLASLQPGDSVSAGSTSSASSSSSSSSSSTGGGSGGGGSAGGSATAGSLGGSSSSSSTSSPFAEIVNTGTMTMTVALSESDIANVKLGQSATVTPDALSGVELASHVSQIATVGTTSSGVVSYNVTLTLDQGNPDVKPGMSASAAIIVNQAQGVTVPNQAVTGSGSLGTVNVMENGKTVSKQVIVGLRGDSRTQIVSGLSAGQQLVITIALPSVNSSTSTTSSSTGTLGGGGFGGAGGFGGGGGGGGLRALFGGGGGFRGGG